jgi:hypothetical protein
VPEWDTIHRLHNTGAGIYNGFYSTQTKKAANMIKCIMKSIDFTAGIFMKL